MNLRKERLKIILVSLLLIILALLIYFYFIRRNESAVMENNSAARYSKEQMTHDVDSILLTFGIERKWIKNISGESIKSKDGLMLSKEVTIPPDLLTIDLNYEVTNYFRKHNMTTRVTEDPKSKNIFMSIYSSGDSIEQAIGLLKFNYSEKIRRDQASVCIILDSLDFYNLDEAEKILKSTQEFSVILPLNNDKAEYQSKIIDLRRDYVIRFEIGNEENVDADFRVDMNYEVWKQKVKSISMNFPSVSGIFFLEDKSLAQFAGEIKNEFMKSKLTVYEDTLFSQPSGGSDKIKALLDNIETNSEKGKKFLVYIIKFNPGEFAVYDTQLYNLKKRGFRFFNFGNLMNKINRHQSNVTTDTLK